MPDQALLREIDQKLDLGRPLDAYALCERVAPLSRWVDSGPLASFYASRLVSWLGNGRRGHAIATLARRRYPESGDVFLRWLSTVRAREGAWRAFQLMEDRSLQPKLTESQECFLLCQRANYLAWWMDFETALDLLDRAEERRPNYDRSAVMRAVVLRRADRSEEALEWAEIAMERRPGNVSAPELKSELLLAKGQDEEALQTLREADQRVQDSDIAVAIANWHDEREQYSEALAMMERAEALMPLASRSIKEWVAGRRAFWHYLRGDKEAALKQVAIARDCFTAEIADRLREGKEGKRVRLQVPFVRQDHRTCAPATLAAICRYWGHDAEHVDIAEAICYDGTPDHHERHWATENGYLAREFRVTPEAAKSLIDRGVPFTLTTVEPASAHLQGVIGYDETADTLIIREPGWAHFSEFRMKVIEDYAFSGPRGMIVVPNEKKALVDGIELPDAEIYDALHALQRALKGNDREKGVNLLERLRKEHPGHLLTLMGERALAVFERDHSAQLKAIDGMLALYPKQAALLYTKLLLLGSTAGRQEQIDFAKEVIAAGDAPSEVSRKLASLLDDDARDWPKAHRAWDRAIRRSPFDGSTLSGLADFLWDLRRRKESVRLYRLAACVNVLSEHDARTFFRAARWTGQQDEALEFLRRRVRLYGSQSGDPAETLSWALESADRTTESLAVLDAAIKERPQDGNLLIYASGRYLAYGKTERANGLLAEAKALTAPGQWLRYAADAAVASADLDRALTLRREVVVVEPTSRDGHRDLADLLAACEGHEAAVAHLEKVCQTYPGNAGLHALLAGYLENDLDRKMDVVRHMITLDAADSWAYRELAVDLTELKRFEEAEKEARLALAVSPGSAGSWGILADVLMESGRSEEALTHFRKAVELDADYAYGISSLMDLSLTKEARAATLEYCLAEMEKQVVSGDGLSRWHGYAWVEWEPEKVLGILKEITEVRPDLWQAWSVLLNHLLRMGQSKEALRVAEESTSRFPLLPRIWLDLAEVHQNAGDPEKERAALDEALALNPRWSTAVLRYAYVSQTLGERAAAREILERHTRVKPLDSDVLLRLVALLREDEDSERELAFARRATKLAPLNSASWEARVLAANGDRAEMAAIREETCKQTEALPLSVSAWECRALVEEKAENFAEKLAILNESEKTLPNQWDLVEAKLVLLTELGRYDEALACCSMEGVPDVQRHWREARAAWVQYRSGRHEEGIARMCKVAEARPEYRWAADRLLEWYDVGGDQEEVVHWASVVHRLAPRDSVPLGYRAGALLKLERVSEAEEDLVRATTLSPGYGWATEHLLELQLKRGDTDAAERTVARVRGRSSIAWLANIWTANGFADQGEAYARAALEEEPDEAANFGALSKALWSLGEKGDAVEASWQCCKRLPEASAPWETLKTRAQEAELLEDVSRKALEWCREEPSARMRWLSLYDIQDSGEGRLDVLEHALEHHPDDLRMLDLKPWNLAEMRRYTEALQHCRDYDTEERADDMRASMRRRAAWIEHVVGRTDEAIAKMTSALEMEPGNVWALERLCDWLEAAERPKEAVPWAEKLIEAAPRESTSFGFLASSLMLADRKEEAVPHLKRALQMNPGYTWAADQLFDLQMASKDVEGGEATLRMIRDQVDEDEVLSKEVCLHALAKREDEAFASWDRLVRIDEEAEQENLSVADDALKGAGWDKRLEEHWKRRSEETDWSSAVAARWVSLRCAAGELHLWKKFRELPFDDDERISAWKTYINAANAGRENGRKEWPREMKRALKSEGEYLKQSVDSWSKVTWYYACTGNHGRRERAWVADWQSREGLEAWMLVNVANILDSEHFGPGGMPVRKWAVENLPADHGASFNRAHLALYAARKGNLSEARNYLNDINETDFDSSSSPAHMKFLTSLGRVLTDLMDPETPKKERRKQAAVAYRQTLKAFADNLHHPTFCKTLKRFLVPAIRHAGFSPLAVRFAWRLYREF